MSYYTVCVNQITVMGKTWAGYTGFMEYSLRDYDLENIKARSESGELTREAISDWLDCNSGDFQYIIDFCADIADFFSDWENEENGYKYLDAMYPEFNEE